MKDILLVPAVATMIVGVIAAIVSLVAAILAKDQKTSEFRQAWIDSVRNDVSQLIAHHAVALPLSRIVRSKGKAENEEYLIAHQKEFLEIAMLTSRVRLRLNAVEHRVLISLLSGVADESEKSFELRTENIACEAQAILKAEWERVKRGEPSVVRLKRVSRILIWGVGASMFSLTAISLYSYLTS